jgi:hypothetical protein
MRILQKQDDSEGLWRRSGVLKTNVRANPQRLQISILGTGEIPQNLPIALPTERPNGAGEILIRIEWVVNSNV